MNQRIAVESYNVDNGSALNIPRAIGLTFDAIGNVVEFAMTILIGSVAIGIVCIVVRSIIG